MPILTRERLFEEIAIDFIGELLESEDFNAILIVTDQFTKVLHYIPVKTTWTAEEVANSYINDIWKLYSLLRHITLNQSPQFASKFLKEMHQKINIHMRRSTAHILQTDGLSEQVDQILKQYLRIYCDNRQNCWQV